MKIFLDTANKEEILAHKDHPLIHGYTTNPSLLRKAGVTDYEKFAREILKEITDKPISLEVISDELGEMEKQARKIATWGENIYVKIPISTTGGEFSFDIIESLQRDGIKVNVTAVFTGNQIGALHYCLDPDVPAIVSIFSGRIADTGVDPTRAITAAYALFDYPIEILWASTRQVFNIYEADKYNAHIITVTPDLLKKYEAMQGKSLDELSRETIQMFYNDAKSSGLKI